MTIGTGRLTCNAQHSSGCIQVQLFWCDRSPSRAFDLSTSTFPARLPMCASSLSFLSPSFTFHSLFSSPLPLPLPHISHFTFTHFAFTYLTCVTLRLILLLRLMATLLKWRQGGPACPFTGCAYCFGILKFNKRLARTYFKVPNCSIIFIFYLLKLQNKLILQTFHIYFRIEKIILFKLLIFKPSIL